MLWRNKYLIFQAGSFIFFLSIFLKKQKSNIKINICRSCRIIWYIIFGIFAQQEWILESTIDFWPNILNFYQKVRFFTKHFDFDQKFRVWTKKFDFRAKNSIFNHKFLVLTEIWSFYQNSSFWSQSGDHIGLFSLMIYDIAYVRMGPSESKPVQFSLKV